MSNTIKTILFALGLCFVCGTLLATAAKGLRGLQHKNIVTDQRKNILDSVGLIDNQKPYTTETINTMYTQNIEKVSVDNSGRVIDKAMEDKLPGTKTLPIYLYIKSDGAIESYIIPIDTKGLWGKIHGYLALRNDGSTIRGFTVYKHSETPGLGGEIEKKWFQKNFIGKKIVNQKGSFVSISIAKGKVQGNIPKDRLSNYVDGISGATLTGKFLSEGLKETLKTYEPVSIKFRKHNFKDYPQIEKSTSIKK